MRIKRARIQNFRCLEDVEIAFDSVTTFIGPNGVGKSTVLRALDWFFNGGYIGEEDLLHDAAQPRIRVEVEFDNLTQTDREVLGKYAPEPSDTVTVWRTWEAGEEKITGKAFAYLPFEEIRRLSRATDKKIAYNELRSAQPHLELPVYSNAQVTEIAMSSWEREHLDQLQEAEVSDTNFFGFAGQGKMSGLFDYVLVTADLRASEETQDSKSAILGRILERTIDRTSADQALIALSGKFQVDQGTIFDEHFRPQLETLSNDLTHAVAAFSRGRAILVRPQHAEPKPTKVQFTVGVIDNETVTRVDRQGHGFQRTLLIAALKLLAERGAAAGQQGVICLAIEEPELFQHPTQARVFASVLRRLAQDDRQQIQVTYATHSPLFIEATHFPQVRRVSRRITQGASTQPVTISHATYHDAVKRLDGFVTEDIVKRQMDAVCLTRLPEALFADAVVLVEGDTDRAVIEGCAERDGQPFAMDGLAVAEAGSKTSLLLPHAILTLLGIPCYVIFDGDKGCGDRMRIRGNSSEAEIRTEINKQARCNRRMLRYLGQPEEDWPVTSVNHSYAVFAVFLEDELGRSWPEWNAQLQELVNSGAGFLKKNSATYRHATFTAPGKVPDVLQQVLTAVRATRER